MKISSIFYLIIFLHFNINAQEIEYLFIAKVGGKQEVHNLTLDTGNHLLSSPSKEDFSFSSGGIYTVGLEMRKKNYVADVNFSAHEYNTYVGRIPNGGRGVHSRTSNKYNSFDLVLAGGYRLSLFNDRIAFTPSLGFGGAYFGDFSLDNPGSGSSKRTHISDSGEVIDAYEATLSYVHYTRWNIYTHANIEMDFKINPYLSLFLSVDYTGGVLKVMETNVEYYLQQEPTRYDARYASNGSYFSLNSGLKFPLNWMWAKKE